MALGLHNIHNQTLVVLAERQHPQIPAWKRGRLVERRCENAACGRIFVARATDVKRGHGRFCSRPCASVEKGQLTNLRHSQAGAGNHNFKGWASRNKRVYVDRFRAKYPEKARAHAAVQGALRAGHLVRPATCERCGGAALVHAHHPDYSRPLAVVFVCRPCHRVLDAERQQARCAS